MHELSDIPALDEALDAIDEPTTLARSTAARLAAAYFLGTGGNAFSGASFEYIGHRWDEPSTTNEITASDPLALGTLMTPLERFSAVELLSPSIQAEATPLLAAVPTHASIGGAEALEQLAASSAMSELYTLVRGIDGMGKTRTSKLLARKRAGLVPIRDENVEWAVGGSNLAEWWLPFRTFVMTPRDAVGHSYFDLAQAIHEAVGLNPAVTPLRTLDAILWTLGRRRA